MVQILGSHTMRCYEDITIKEDVLIPIWNYGQAILINEKAKRKNMQRICCHLWKKRRKLYMCIYLLEYA